MKIRFRKSINIAPGIKINLGSKGVTGATFGKRGASVGVNKRGVRANATIPNTGVSLSQDLIKFPSAKIRSKQVRAQNDDLIGLNGFNIIVLVACFLIIAWLLF